MPGSSEKPDERPTSPEDAKPLPTDPNQQPSEAATKAANMVNAGRQEAMALGEGVETEEAKAEKYCSQLESKMDGHLSNLFSVENARVSASPDPKEMQKKTDETQDQFQARWDEANAKYNEKSSEYKGKIKALLPQFIRNLKAADPKSSKLLNMTLGLEANADVAGQEITRYPSDVIKSFYRNYKTAGEPDGGWAVSEDLSDLPPLVENGDIQLANFQRRSNAIERTVSDIAKQAEKLKVQYCG